MRRASALLAALGALALGGCVVQPPPIPLAPVATEVDGVTVTIDMPARLDVGDVSAVGDCAVARVLLRMGDGFRSLVEVLATTPAVSCPDEDALNGRYPTWGPADPPPADAQPVDVPGATTAYRFSFEYTECTNSCTTVVQQVLLAVVDDEHAVMVLGVGTSPPEDLGAWLETVRIG